MDNLSQEIVLNCLGQKYNCKLKRLLANEKPLKSTAYGGKCMEQEDSSCSDKRVDLVTTEKEKKFLRES